MILLKMVLKGPVNTNHFHTNPGYYASSMKCVSDSGLSDLKKERRTLLFLRKSCIESVEKISVHMKKKQMKKRYCMRAFLNI